MADAAYTVVIPAYNAARFIADAVNSVLAQTVSPNRIVIVDDGSTDDTAKVARSLGSVVHVISTSNRGPGQATTTGMGQVTTPIVAMLDADDVWRPHKMQRQLACLLDAGAKPDAVLAKMASFGQTDLKTGSFDDSGWHRSTLTMWTEAFHRVGPVQGMRNGYGEMIDWFARAREAKLSFHLIDEGLADRRIHADSLSFTAGPGRDSDYLQTAIRALQRKKQAGL